MENSEPLGRDDLEDSDEENDDDFLKEFLEEEE